MVEKTTTQQQRIETQAEELRAMKQCIDQFRSVNMETQYDMTETFQELEDNNEEAERRTQYLEMKGCAKSKANVAPPTPPDDDYDDPGPDDFQQVHIMATTNKANRRMSPGVLLLRVGARTSDSGPINA